MHLATKMNFKLFVTSVDIVTQSKSSSIFLFTILLNFSAHNYIFYSNVAGEYIFAPPENIFMDALACIFVDTFCSFIIHVYIA